MKKTFSFINFQVPKRKSGPPVGLSTFHGIGMNTEIITARVKFFAFPLVKFHYLLQNS